MKTVEEKSRDWYNRIADNYDNLFEGRFTEKFKKLLLEEIKIKPNDSILDVACGNGRLLKMLASKYAIKGYGVDITEKMIENARKNCPDMVFEVT
ncbi:MAG TPA: methyltransferase domain-containing protein, partial [Desulfitobacteriaceae bacterium]|nr:methyltransferase domain-containing protein [Desulfitobacteriaceae bacterium]